MQCGSAITCSNAWVLAYVRGSRTTEIDREVGRHENSWPWRRHRKPGDRLFRQCPAPSSPLFRVRKRGPNRQMCSLMEFLHHASFGIGVLGVLVIVFGVLCGLVRFILAEVTAVRGGVVE